jgi:hypothetical protein
MQAAYPQSVSEKIGKVMADAFYTALAAFVFGVCVAGTIKRMEGAFFGGTIFSGGFVIFGVLWTRHAIGRLLTAKYTTSEAAKRSARQLVGYCVAFAMTSFSFGLEVMGALRSSDAYYTFSAFAWGIISCIWFYGIYRQAKRLTSALV